MPRRSASAYSFETIPAKIFIRLLSRNDAVAERVVGKISWHKIKEKWLLSREDDKGSQLLEARRALLLETCKFNKVRILAQWLPSIDEEKAKEVFKEIRVGWDDDFDKRAQRLKRLLNKHSEMAKKHARKVKELEEGDGEEVKEFTIDDFNQAIASLELVGFSIEDYEKLTLAKYEAISKTVKKKADATERANTRT